MSDHPGISEHYGRPDLLSRIDGALKAAKAQLPLDLDTLALIDEFHIGGRVATELLVPQLRVSAASQILDLGCGLGGPARFVAKTTGAHVTGVDLTPEFITAAKALTGMALMIDRVSLRQADILDLPFAADRFDAAYMIHVGMNIADKAALMASVARVLKPGGIFAIYDVMALTEAGVTFPVPWASYAAHSALASPQAYRAALADAGFTRLSETDRSDLLRPPPADAADSPLGLHLVMGPEIATKVANMASAVRAGAIAPIEMIARLG